MRTKTDSRDASARILANTAPPESLTSIERASDNRKPPELKRRGGAVSASGKRPAVSGQNASGQRRAASRAVRLLCYLNAVTGDDLFEWLKAVTRWIHVFAVILWIGQTYLFNFFEDSLERDSSDPENVLGNVWMVHGGGFYQVRKHRRLRESPRVLHWFKWEAATTWLSGVVLIFLTYYMGGLLVEPGMDYGLAAALGVFALVAGWLVYDLLARSRLADRSWLFAGTGWLLIVALTYGLNHVQSPRAVFIHVGALLGTIMAANVWVRILPAQRRLIALAGEGKRPDPRLESIGPTRSRHNSYLVIPLVFIMLSNHYPTISYGHDQNWLMLGILLIAGWVAAHLFQK